MAAAKGTSKVAADAADTVTDKRFASVGSSQGALSPKCLKDICKPMARPKHDQGFSGTAIPQHEETQPQPHHLDAITNICPLVFVGPIVNHKDTLDSEQDTSTERQACSVRHLSTVK